MEDKNTTESSISMTQVAFIFFCLHVVFIGIILSLYFYLAKPLIGKIYNLVAENNKRSATSTSLVTKNNGQLATPVPQDDTRTQLYNLISSARNDFASGAFDAGLAKANQALPLAQTDSDKAEVHYWIGLFYYQKQDIIRAEPEIKLAISLKPDMGEAYSTLSAINLAKSNYPLAEAMARKSIELSPDYPWGYNDLGLALLFQGKKDEGISNLEKAVQLDPEAYVFQDNLKRAKAGSF